VNTYCLRKLAFCIFCACLSAPAAEAQSVDPVETARVQVGPLGVTPSFSLRNLGIDSNVFNAINDPKRDFTFTASPELSVWFRAGDSRLAVHSRADLVYFSRYASERSIDGEFKARWDVPFNRVTPWVSAGYLHARQRAGYEIDLRSERTAEQWGGGVMVRVTPMTAVGITAGRMTHRHDADEFFRGSSLQQTLNRETTRTAFDVRHDLTPLTTVVIEVESVRDRFEYSPLRDADSMRVQGGFDLDRSALIFGRGRVGYRSVEGVDASLPSFRGVTAAVDAGTTLFGRARVDVAVMRDLAYSIEAIYPYYVQTGATLTVTPQLTDTWDVQGRAGTQRLAYEAARDFAAIERVDRYSLVGGGIGYRFGRDLRLGFNVDRERRRSPLQSREYAGYRAGTSVTYGR